MLNKEKYQKLVDRLINIKRFRKKANYEALNRLINHLNIKEEAKIIHVAGTNGKGSVSTMIYYMLREHGYKVGLFTSPHLIDVRERFKVYDEFIKEDDFINIYTKINTAIKECDLEGSVTFFETALLIAMLYFKKEKCDFIVLESGIGGENDSTNVFSKKAAAVITGVSLDHTHLLGETVERIAMDKLGIARKDTPLIYCCEDEYEEIIRKKHKIINFIPVPVKKFPNNYKYLMKSIVFIPVNVYYNYEGIRLSTVDENQLKNATVAIETLYNIKDIVVYDENVKLGLEKFYIRGRMEYLRDDLLVDIAHNEGGINNLIDYLNKYNDKGIELFFTLMSDKDIIGVVSSFKRLKKIKKIFLVDKVNNRAVDSVYLKEVFAEYGFDAVITEDLHDIDRINDNLKIVTGSLYIVSNAIQRVDRR